MIKSSIGMPSPPVDVVFINSLEVGLPLFNLFFHVRIFRRKIRTSRKIKKIVGDIFKISPPKVGSATFIHTFDILIGFIVVPDINPERTKQITDLFLKITRSSKAGLLVKETNMSGGLADHVVDTLAKTFKYEGLTFAPVQASAPSYVYPSGKVQVALPVAYVVT